MLAIQRRFAALWQTEHWTPLVPTLQPDVYASLWEDQGVRLWTLVNRSARQIEGPLLAANLAAGDGLYDLVAGTQVAGGDTVAGSLSPRGIGCFVAAGAGALGADFPQFLEHPATTGAARQSGHSVPCASDNIATKLNRPQRYSTTRPDNMIRIPGRTVEMMCELRERECGFYESNPPAGHGLHNSYEIRLKPFPRKVSLTDYFMDLTPVTNAQFQEFLQASGYEPQQREEFSASLDRTDAPPAGKGDHPVVYVDLDDARAYARWAGKRLPTEEEWQYAAQGPDAWRYPWGNEMLPGRCNGGESGGTTSVKAFPDGRSAFGIWDLCGNVWEWTESQRSDGRTRFCIIKGGAILLRPRVPTGTWMADRGPTPSRPSSC